MNLRSDQELQVARIELQSAEAELDKLTRQLRTFEARVDDRLGSLLDQLTELNAETSALDEKLKNIREARLFGTDLLRYLDGAPRPARPLDLKDLPPTGLPQREAAQKTAGGAPGLAQPPFPDIKILYRQLARRYHPDLARNDADRILSNEQMKGINQAYKAGDLQALMKLAGITIQYGVEVTKLLDPVPHPDEPISDLERVNRKLREVHRQISRLGSLPIVKLSLDVKLARYAKRDLLGEMVGELQYKLARKMAERDYLKAQIKVNEV